MVTQAADGPKLHMQVKIEHTVAGTAARLIRWCPCRPIRQLCWSTETCPMATLTEDPLLESCPETPSPRSLLNFKLPTCLPVARREVEVDSAK